MTGYSGYSGYFGIWEFVDLELLSSHIQTANLFAASVDEIIIESLGEGQTAVHLGVSGIFAAYLCPANDPLF